MASLATRGRNPNANFGRDQRGHNSSHGQCHNDDGGGRGGPGFGNRRQQQRDERGSESTEDSRIGAHSSSRGRGGWGGGTRTFYNQRDRNNTFDNHDGSSNRPFATNGATYGNRDGSSNRSFANSTYGNRGGGSGHCSFAMSGPPDHRRGGNNFNSGGGFVPENNFNASGFNGRGNNFTGGWGGSNGANRYVGQSDREQQHPQGRGGGFGRDSGFAGRNETDIQRQPYREYRDEEERLRERSHIPTHRAVDEIFLEDLNAKENYQSIREEDDDVCISGVDLPQKYQQILDKWDEAAFEPGLMENIKRAQYIVPRKIQSRTIPLIQDGHDVKGHAETGSGKSAAFLLPIIDVIMKRKKEGKFASKRSCPYALILEPTRELTIQVYEQAKKLAQDCNVSVSLAYGKFLRSENLREISTVGCDILVGTMGRVLDFFQNLNLLCDNLKVLVLDEADQLLEDSFSSDLRRLAKVDGWPATEQRQTLLFSATFPMEVQHWADEWMRAQSVFVSNRKLVAANGRVAQHFVRVSRVDKSEELLKLLMGELEEAKRDNPDNPKIRPTMVFVQMKRIADVVSTYLNLRGFKTTTINGDRPQELREQSLNAFRKGLFQVVVTTDVCARGIDIKGLDRVVNMDLPTQYIDYVQRIGRTGRLRHGIATSFFDPDEDAHMAQQLVQGLQSVNQLVPEWLKQAAGGNNNVPPPPSEPVATPPTVPVQTQEKKNVETQEKKVVEADNNGAAVVAATGKKLEAAAVDNNNVGNTISETAATVETPKMEEEEEEEDEADEDEASTEEESDEEDEEKEETCVATPAAVPVQTQEKKVLETDDNGAAAVGKKPEAAAIVNNGVGGTTNKTAAATVEAQNVEEEDEDEADEDEASTEEESDEEDEEEEEKTEGEDESSSDEY